MTRTISLSIYIGLIVSLASNAPYANDEKARATLFRDSDTNRQPAITLFPDYPTIARRDRIEGEATVCFRIDESGKIKRVSMKNYSHKIFRRPALRAIRKSTFEPLAPGEIAIKTSACRTFRFRLQPVDKEIEES